jgi:hypothetical protein
MLMKLCEANNLEYNINAGVLNVSEENGLLTKDTQLAPVLNEHTGLIDHSIRLKQGVSLRRIRSVVVAYSLEHC